jgi:hypothetical protein
MEWQPMGGEQEGGPMAEKKPKKRQAAKEQPPAESRGADEPEASGRIGVYRTPLET